MNLTHFVLLSVLKHLRKLIRTRRSQSVKARGSQNQICLKRTDDAQVDRRFQFREGKPRRKLFQEKFSTIGRIRNEFNRRTSRPRTTALDAFLPKVLHFVPMPYHSLPSASEKQVSVLQIALC
jgi:hypothetical protein